MKALANVHAVIEALDMDILYNCGAGPLPRHRHPSSALPVAREYRDPSNATAVVGKKVYPDSSRIVLSSVNCQVADVIPVRFVTFAKACPVSTTVALAGSPTPETIRRCKYNCLGAAWVAEPGGSVHQLYGGLSLPLSVEDHVPHEESLGVPPEYRITHQVGSSRQEHGLYWPRMTTSCLQGTYNGLRVIRYSITFSAIIGLHVYDAGIGRIEYVVVNQI